jgi:hypothetical protein
MAGGGFAGTVDAIHLYKLAGLKNQLPVALD